MCRFLFYSDSGQWSYGHLRWPWTPPRPDGSPIDHPLLVSPMHKLIKILKLVGKTWIVIAPEHLINWMVVKTVHEASGPLQ